MKHSLSRSLSPVSPISSEDKPLFDDSQPHSPSLHSSSRYRRVRTGTSSKKNVNSRGNHNPSSSRRSHHSSRILKKRNKTSSSVSSLSDTSSPRLPSKISTAHKKDNIKIHQNFDPQTLYKDEEDKEWLDGLKEFEREAELARRHEAHIRALQRKQLFHQDSPENDSISRDKSSNKAFPRIDSTTFSSKNSKSVHSSLLSSLNKIRKSKTLEKEKENGSFDEKSSISITSDDDEEYIEGKKKPLNKINKASTSYNFDETHLKKKESFSSSKMFKEEEKALFIDERSHTIRKSSLNGLTFDVIYPICLTFEQILQILEHHRANEYLLGCFVTADNTQLGATLVLRYIVGLKETPPYSLSHDRICTYNLLLSPFPQVSSSQHIASMKLSSDKFNSMRSLISEKSSHQNIFNGLHTNIYDSKHIKNLNGNNNDQTSVLNNIEVNLNADLIEEAPLTQISSDPLSLGVFENWFTFIKRFDIDKQLLQNIKLKKKKLQEFTFTDEDVQLILDRQSSNDLTAIITPPLLTSSALVKELVSIQHEIDAFSNKHNEEEAKKLSTLIVKKEELQQKINQIKQNVPKINTATSTFKKQSLIAQQNKNSYIRRECKPSLMWEFKNSDSQKTKNSSILTKDKTNSSSLNFGDKELLSHKMFPTIKYPLKEQIQLTQDILQVHSSFPNISSVAIKPASTPMTFLPFSSHSLNSSSVISLEEYTEMTRLAVNSMQQFELSNSFPF